MRNDSGLLESIHAFDDLNVKKSLVFKDGKKALLINYYSLLDIVDDKRFV